MSRPSAARVPARIRPVKAPRVVRASMRPAQVRSFVSLLDASPEEIERCLNLAADMKAVVYIHTWLKIGQAIAPDQGHIRGRNS